MKISTIIVTHNGKQHLKTCLGSFKGQWPFEVIIVDNASTDGTREWIKKNYPQVIFVASKKNLGFAGGNNLGISKANGTHIFILNNDTKLSKNFFKEIEKHTEKLKAKMFSLKILYWNKKIDTLGLQFNKLGFSKDIKKVEDLKHLRGPCGAGAIYEKELLESIKNKNDYYDNRFFMYCEDVDLAWRAQRKGFLCAHIPTILFHKHGASTEHAGVIRDPFLYFFLRNRILAFKKNTVSSSLHIPFFILQSAVLFKYVLKGRGMLALRAIIHGYKEKIIDPEKIISSYA